MVTDDDIQDWYQHSGIISIIMINAVGSLVICLTKISFKSCPLILFKFRTEAHELMSLGLPIILTQLLQISIMTLDVVMAGRASTLDLAGVSLGGNIWSPIFFFFYGVIIVLTPIVAQAYGSNRHELIVPTVYQSFWISLTASIVSILILINVDSLLYLFDFNEDIRLITSDYLEAYCFGVPALFLFNVLRSYANGLSLTRAAMFASIIGLIVNAPLNYVFIYGKFGFPPLGGVGCGWASSIALWSTFISMAFFVSYSSRFRKIQLFDKLYYPNWTLIKEQLKLGFPLGGVILIEVGAYTTIGILLSLIGPIEVAAHQIALSIYFTIYMVSYSLGQSLTIRVAFFLGSNNPLAARLSSSVGILLIIIWSSLVCTLLYYCASFIVKFYTEDNNLRTNATSLVFLAALFYIPDSILYVCTGSLRGYKDTKIPMLIMAVAFWGVCLPVGYLFGMMDWLGSALKAKGFWVGLILGVSVAAILFTIRLYILSNRLIFSRTNSFSCTDIKST